MGKIIQLDETLTNKIAAGEVVERPASVVKELVENSIDARSTVIEVEILEAGLKQIRVIDNGEGMSEEDAVMAFERHATSKIKSEEDLFRIRTLGFRGRRCQVSLPFPEWNFRPAPAKDRVPALSWKGVRLSGRSPVPAGRGRKSWSPICSIILLPV